MMNTCDNHDLFNYFDKNFAEYKKGFESKGKNYSSHLPSHRSLIFWGLCEYLVNTFKLKVSTMYWEFWNQANPPIWDFHTHTRANKFWNIELISGEVWLGLEALHKLTSVGSYRGQSILIYRMWSCSCPKMLIAGPHRIFWEYASG